MRLLPGKTAAFSAIPDATVATWLGSVRGLAERRKCDNESSQTGVTCRTIRVGLRRCVVRLTVELVERFALATTLSFS